MPTVIGTAKRRRWALGCAVAVIVTIGGGLAIAQGSGAGGATNTLTPEEKAAGWRLLFDGVSTKGWHSFQKDGVTGWEAKNGELTTNGKGGDLVTNDLFGSFELLVDWKLAPKGNSGIIYHVVEKGFNATYVTGPEYQLIDVEGWPEHIETWQWTGANYAMHPPTVPAWKKIGEWNQTRIVVDVTHVEHWLNGIKVAEYEFWTPDWVARSQGGKWKDYPAYGLAKKGAIALQEHGSSVWFRNIKIRPR